MTPPQADTALTEDEALLAQAVRAKREALVALLQDLVRIPSVNPPGAEYANCARLVGDFMARSGFAPETIRARGALADDDDWPRINVICRKDGDGPGPCVHFNSHYDVVPPGEGWTMDPYCGDVRDGRV